MSNARSPREVCSTTMGTSGLIVSPRLVSRPCPDSFRLATWCPQLLGSRRRLALGHDVLLRSPQLLPRRRPLHRDRCGALHDQLDRLARGEILAQLFLAAGLAQLCEHLLGREPLALG